MNRLLVFVFLFLIGCSILIGLRDARTMGITAIILFPLMYAFFEGFLNAGLPKGISFYDIEDGHYCF